MTYTARGFVATDDGFATDGLITIKGSHYLAPFDFSVHDDGKRRVLNGTAVLDRLVLMLGVKDYPGTALAGQYVTEIRHVEATVTE